MFPKDYQPTNPNFLEKYERKSQIDGKSFGLPQLTLHLGLQIDKNENFEWEIVKGVEEM